MNAWAASAWGVAVVAERELKERCNSARRWDSVTPSVSAHMKGRSYSRPPTITAGLGRSQLKSFPATLHYHVRSIKREISIMSTIDANRVIFTGENSAIRLSNNDSDSFTTNATFWRAVSSGAGSGHVLYLKSELTEARWRIYSDNIAMARLLQSTVLGAIYAELLDPTIAVIDAQFSRSGDVRDFWTERLVTRDEEVVLTWYEMGEPFLVHTQPTRQLAKRVQLLGLAQLVFRRPAIPASALLCAAPVFHSARAARLRCGSVRLCRVRRLEASQGAHPHREWL